MATPKSKHRREPGGHFNLQEEKTKTRVSGYGHGDFIKLKDEYGNVWLGSAENRGGQFDCLPLSGWHPERR